MTLKTFKCRFVRVEHRPGFKDEEKVVAIKEVYANSVADAETIARSIAENDRIQWKCPINYTRIDVVQVQTKVPA